MIWAEGALLADGLPENFKRLFGAFDAACLKTMREDHRVHGARARCADTFDLKTAVIQNTVKNPPGESTVRSAALQGQGDLLLFTSFFRHDASFKIINDLKSILMNGRVYGSGLETKVQRSG
jgi:hypothetical protein